jgi:hypothetical protein
MTLGSPILSYERMGLGQIALFARWSDEVALEHFLSQTKAGSVLNHGWHVRLQFLRRWGAVDGFDD